MASVSIVFRKDKINKQGLAPIHIRIIKDRKPRYVTTGYMVHELDWDDKNKRIKGRGKDAETNARINADISLQFADTAAKTATAGQGVSAQMQAVSYGDESARRTDQVALHRGAYCSVSEHKAGLCKVSAMGLQSADADFSMLVKGGTKGSSERSAGYDFIDNVVPVRATAACSSPSCLARLADIRTMNSLDSLARNTLISMIEARSVQNP